MGNTNSDTSDNNIIPDKHASCLEKGKHYCEDRPSGISDYVEIDIITKSEQCCLNKDKYYNLYAVVERNSSIYYSFYMKSCCYAKLTGNDFFTNCVREKGLFPFNIGVIELVKLNAEDEIYGFRANNFRMFKLPNSLEKAKFSKVPYIGSLI